MKRVKLFSFLMIFCMLVTLINVTPITIHAEDTYKIIVIGDSRVVGLGITAGASSGSTVEKEINGVYYRGQNSKGYDYCEDLVTAIKNKCTKDTVVYVCFGVNDLGNVDKYIELYKTMSASLNGATIKVAEVGGIDQEIANKNGYSVTNADITSFNTKIKDNAENYTVIDFWQGDESANTRDGVHYTNSFNEKTVEWLEKQANVETEDIKTGGSDGSWCTVHCRQGDGWYNSHCTFFTFYHMLQNSGQCNSEAQIDAGSYNRQMDADNTAKLELLHSVMWSGGLLYDFTSGMNKYSNSKWIQPTDFSESDYTTGDASGGYGIVITHFGDKKLSELYTDDHNKFIQVCQLLYNNGYWLYVGVDGSGGDGIGPSGYGAGHTVMISGVTADKVYLNDSACVDSSVVLEEVYDSICWIGLYKNEKVSLKDASGGSGFTGTDGEGGNDIGVDPLVFKGFYPEADLSAYCKLVECNINEMYIDDAQIQNLTGDELEAIDNWKTNAGIEDTDTKIVKFIRKIVQLFGIILTVWALLFYLSFWFDRLNNFFDFSLVEVMSFKKLRTSDTEEECTYRASDLGKTNQRTVNHRAVLSISLIAIAFGVLLITGLIYNLISGIVLKAIKFFG